ncbi:ATP-binding protein [Azospirillum sp. sgz302134]
MPAAACPGILARMDDRLILSVSDDPGAPDQLAEWVEAFVARAGLPAEAAFRVNLCFDELIANVRTHGRAATIRVGLELEEGALRGWLEDDGAAHDPFANPQYPDLTAGIADRPVGGLGIHLVRQSATEVAYRREGGRNVTSLLIKTS